MINPFWRKKAAPAVKPSATNETPQTKEDISPMNIEMIEPLGNPDPTVSSMEIAKVLGRENSSVVQSIRDHLDHSMGYNKRSAKLIYSMIESGEFPGISVEFIENRVYPTAVIYMAEYCVADVFAKARGNAIDRILDLFRDDAEWNPFSDDEPEQTPLVLRDPVNIHLPAMSNDNPTMSSSEIAELVESRHQSVRRTIDRLMEKGVIQLTPLVYVKNPQGQDVETYNLAKRDSFVVVAQLSPEFTARLVDRWQELENKASEPSAPALPDFSDPSAAARAWADQFEASKAMQIENQQQTAQIIQMKPKAEAFDLLGNMDGSLTPREAAKMLKLTKNVFCQWMVEMGEFYRNERGDLQAYAKHISAGRYYHGKPKKRGKLIKTQVYVTASGMTRLARMLHRN